MRIDSLAETGGVLAAIKNQRPTVPSAWARENDFASAMGQIEQEVY